MDIKGLTSQEVSERKIQGLVNRSAKYKTRTHTQIFVENIFSLFNLIILGVILFVLFFYFRSGDIRLLYDTIGMLIISLTNTLIAIYQEIKAKIAIDKVNLLVKRQVTVVRDGKNILIEQNEIVKNDTILISRGDQVIVDGKVIKSNHLEIDESLLTGESIPILKNENDTVLSGSFCIAGSGYYTAEKIGADSYAHTITGLAKRYKFNLTPLQKKINIILKILFVCAVILSLFKAIFGFPFGRPELFNDFIREIATILISLIPQGLVLISSVTFSVGIYRISRIGAIVEKLNAIESFSNVQIVCMDKTGTLTQNKLKVHFVTNLSDEYDDSQMKQLLGAYAEHSTEKNATIRALEIFENIQSFEYLDSIPFSSDKKMSLLRLKKSDKHNTFILGACDILLERVDAEKKRRIEDLIISNNISPYRNLMFGEIVNSNPDFKLTDDITGLSIKPLCIVSISDTIREDVYEAIELFKKNGIEFKILSGDSTEAIKSVLNQIGWEVSENYICTGKELDKLTESEFDITVFEKIIFSRLNPEHKLKIIKSLRKRGIYTAMIGDGVNDLPAIKESDMGIAMEEGSGITKEVSDIVLLKNKFSLLPKIFDEGNKIVNSVNSIGKLFLTKNFTVIFLTVLSLLFALPFPLTPRRVSLLNIFAIGLPAFILTLRNNNTDKCRNFIKDVFSYVILSALVLNGGGYLGAFISNALLTVSENETDIIIVSIMIFIAVGNFIIVSLDTKSPRKYYYAYGIMLVLIYSLLSFVPIDTELIRIIKMFYEIEYIRPILILIIIAISSLSIFILYAGQKLREKVFRIKS